MRLSIPDFLLIALIKAKSLLDTIGSARVQQFFHKVSSEREERTQGVAAAGRALPLRWPEGTLVSQVEAPLLDLRGHAPISS